MGILSILVLIAGILAVLPAPAHAASAGDTDYQQGQAAVRAGNYTAAAHDYEQALLHGHNDPNTFYQLGLAYEHLKRWNYAAWAIASALSDAVFSGAHPQGMTELEKVQKAGGENAGPPPALANVTVHFSPAPKVDPAIVAVQESQQAFSALGQGAYYVSPGFNQIITFTTANGLVSAAEDSANNSNTTAKFAYLDATPAPYTSLSTYTQDLFTKLGLSRAVLVVVTPKAVAAYSDRLGSAATNQIAAHQWQAIGIKDPVNLAATVERAVVSQADANDSANQRKDVVITIVVIAVVLGVIGLAIFYILRADRSQRRGMQRTKTMGRRPRSLPRP